MIWTFFHPLTLGTLKPRAADQKKESGPESGVPVGEAHEHWREGFDIQEEFEEHPEADIFSLAREGKLPTQGVVLILGEPGAGKSTLLESWQFRWLETIGALTQGARVPIYVPLKSLNREDFDGGIDSLLKRLWEKAQIELGRLAKQIDFDSRLRTDNKALWTPVWLLDGLDECANPPSNDAVWKILAALPGLVLVTCRTAVFQQIRAEAQRWRVVAREYRILPLKPAEQPEFLAQALQEERPELELSNDEARDRAKGLVKRLNASSALRPLATVPLLLRLVAQAGDQFDLPADRAGFYEMAVKKLWHLKLKDRDELESLTVERDQALTQLATAIKLSTLEATTAQCRAAGIVGNLVKALKITGLLRVDEWTEKASFPHPTFQEYFLARSWVGIPFTEVLERHWADPRYEEALGLLVAMRWRIDPAATEADLTNFASQWRARHRRDTGELWRLKRSPFLLVMALIARAGVAAQDPLMGAGAAPLAVRTNLSIRGHLSPHTYERLAEDPDLFVRVWLAKNSATPLHTLVHLADDKYSYVRIAAAKNSAMLPDMLPRLTGDPEPLEDLAYMDADTAVGLQRFVALNDVTPPGTLDRLAGDSDKYVRRGVAGNSATPPDTLASLANDPDQDVRRGVARNSATLPDTLARLADDLDNDVRRWVANHSATPPGALARLATDSDINVLRLVADNSATPPDTLARLADDLDEEVRSGVARNSATPAETLTRLAHDLHEEVRRALVDNSATPPETLARLSDDPDQDVRREVARNSATPPDTLTRLADDLDNDVRRWVANHSATPPGVFARLATDSDKYVQKLVANNRATPPDTLARLANDLDEEVRSGVARNSATPAETLTRLANDEDKVVRSGVAGNSTTPADTLAQLVDDLYNDVRRWVAVNSATPPDTLARLADDPDEFVASCVHSNTSALPEDLWR